jgi:hypothetical protein
MTGLLKETMREQADAQAPPAIDVESLARAGDRRMRRSRLTTGLAAAGVAGILAIGTVLGPQLVGDDGTTDDSLVAGTGGSTAGAFVERLPTYAIDDVIYYGNTPLDVGQRVESFVQTDDGFVYATIDGQIHLADDTTNAPIGHTSPDGLYLKADDTGSLVAWVEFSAGQAPELVVYNTADRKEVVRTDEGTRPDMQSFRDTDSVYVYAVDDRTVYWRNEDGLVALDVETRSSTVLRADATPFDISDVANGHVAHQVFEDENEGSTGLYVSTDLSRPGRPFPSGWEGYLSPGARYISTDQADELAVYDVATREDVTPDTLGYEFVGAYAWLDDSTVTMIGIQSLGRGSQPIDILTCEVPLGACKVTAEGVATYSEDGPVALVLPVGERLG